MRICHAAWTMTHGEIIAEPCVHVANTIETISPVWMWWSFPIEQQCGRLQQKIKSRKLWQSKCILKRSRCTDGKLHGCSHHHIAHTSHSSHRHPDFPCGDFPAHPGLNQRWGNCSVDFLDYLKVVSRGFMPFFCWMEGLIQHG